MYLLHSALVLTILYIPFQLLLRKEHFFTFNRIILLAIIAVSLILPLTHHSIPAEWLDWRQTSPETMTDSSQWTDTPKESMVLVTEELEVSWWQQYGETMLKGLWAIGTLIFLLWQILGGIRLYRILYCNDSIHQKLSDGNILCISTQPISSFSWMHHIVISSDDYAQNGKTILAHEQAHIDHYHSFDKLLLLLCQTLQWWNPFVWLLGDSLNQVHEYQADQSVIDQGINARQYQLLLISKAAGPAGLAMVNGFKHNKLKSRIIMMNNKTILRGAKSRYLALLPMLMLAIACTAKTEKAINTPTVNEASQGRVFFNEIKQTPEVDASTQEVLEYKNATDEFIFLYHVQETDTYCVTLQQEREEGPNDKRNVITMNLSSEDLMKYYKSRGSITLLQKDAPVDCIKEFRNICQKMGIKKISILYKADETLTDSNNQQISCIAEIYTEKSTDNIPVVTFQDNKKPLVILSDGTIIEDINEINPNDIKSIEIAKDKKTQDKYIHLSPLAQNGVIILTLKKDAQPSKN